jgi:hypothetical protein
VKREYPSHVQECFFSSIEGAFLKREMSRAREDKRVGLPCPRTRPARRTPFWDIGMDDETCIWWHQTDGVPHRLIDFYSYSDDGPVAASGWKPGAHRRTAERTFNG